MGRVCCQLGGGARGGSGGRAGEVFMGGRVPVGGWLRADGLFSGRYHRDHYIIVLPNKNRASFYPPTLSLPLGFQPPP